MSERKAIFQKTSNRQSLLEVITMDKNKYLFLFTIGLIQSFIAQARKTQDLYASSFLLSHLIDIGINTLKKNKVEYEHIFPAENIKSKPNRFIVVIDAENREKIEAVGRYIKEAVEGEFKNIAEKVQEKLNLGKDFDEQIKTHLQVYWVALPLDGNDYTDTYRALESYLGAIKNVRQFDQFNNGKGELGRKCSLCGERNVKVYRLTDEEEKKEGLRKRNDGLLSKLYVKEDDVAFFEPRDETDRLKMQKGEGLCAVCFTKRFADRYFEERLEYNYTKHFPSTAQIAAMEWLSKILDKERWDYKAFFNDFDAQLFYEENLERKYLEKYNYFKDDNSLKKAKQKLKEFYDIKSDKNKDKVLGKPSKYYALLMLDGDNMGKWLSGAFLENESELEAFQKALSNALGDYADKVESIIQEPKGKLVYAGGDDVMAFVNLEHLFGILTDLRRKYPNFKEKKEFDKFNITKDSTASCGIVIAHYKTPLSEVLKWARRMAHEAKDKGDRNAFGLAVLKHSGEINKTLLKWDLGHYSNKITAESIKLLENLVNELNDENEGFSNTFIKNLDIELQILDVVDEDILKTELGRLLERACRIKDKKRKSDKVFAGRDNWRDRLFHLYIEAKNVEGTKKENFLSFLNIADFLARKVTR
jgi:CRISPR-associated protein Cmr2